MLAGRREVSFNSSPLTLTSQLFELARQMFQSDSNGFQLFLQLLSRMWPSAALQYRSDGKRASEGQSVRHRLKVSTCSSSRQLLALKSLISFISLISAPFVSHMCRSITFVLQELLNMFMVIYMSSACPAGVTVFLQPTEQRQETFLPINNFFGHICAFMTSRRQLVAVLMS